jgi:hypothetical protein
LQIEAVENKRNLSYGIQLEIQNGGIPDAINLKFDNGASHTIISAEVLVDDLTDRKAEYLEQKLSAKVLIKAGNGSAFSVPFRREFKSATGDTMTGYLADAGEIILGGVKLPHFYYYIIPKNKRSIALLGNDFLRYCKYEHTMEGNILITEIGEDAYAEHYTNAISVDELDEAVDEVGQKE